MTTARFAIARRGAVVAEVVDAAGWLVRRLEDGVRDSGPQVLTWDGRDGAGREVAPGTYFLRLETGETRRIGRVVFLR